MLSLWLHAARQCKLAKCHWYWHASPRKIASPEPHHRSWPNKSLVSCHPNSRRWHWHASETSTSILSFCHSLAAATSPCHHAIPLCQAIEAVKQVHMTNLHESSGITHTCGLSPPTNPIIHDCCSKTCCVGSRKFDFCKKSTSLPTSLEQFLRLSFNTGALQTSPIWVLICLSKLCKLLPCRDTILGSVEETWIMTNFTSWRITCWVFGYPASMMARKSKKEFHHSPFSSGWQQNEGPPLSRQVAASVNAMRLVTIRNAVMSLTLRSGLEKITFVWTFLMHTLNFKKLPVHSRPHLDSPPPT